VRVYELMRKVSVGPLTIRLWVDADGDVPCEMCEQNADEIALCASTLADEDDDPLALAEKLVNTLAGLNAVEVVDANGNGGLVYPDWP
jgi:hypothetical protein